MASDTLNIENMEVAWDSFECVAGEVVEDSFNGVVEDSIIVDMVADSFGGVAGNLIEDSFISVSNVLVDDSIVPNSLEFLMVEEEEVRSIKFESCLNGATIECVLNEKKCSVIDLNKFSKDVDENNSFEVKEKKKVVMRMLGAYLNKFY
ncbi:hypothetical protein RJT34_10049 [Clitoria ternatea]|uniref:Uncharacterized protein n=1 Tax=Clitoria ternatea TaxID=43366 RepID=A0AAN9PVS8_CLITE